MILSAMSWDPGFRGILTVVVATLILGGSVYLLLATNSGARLGFLLALTGLAGWMMIMGLVWAMYGIGYQGRVAAWEVEEVNYGALTEANTADARTVPPRDELPDPRSLIEGNDALETQFPDDPSLREPQLGDLLSVDPTLAEDPALEGIVETDEGWELLGTADSQTGEAAAAASAYLVDERALFTETSDFVVLDSWSKGGKDDRNGDSLLARAAFKAERIVTWPLGHPTHRVVVRVQEVVAREEVPGQPPPTPEADPDEPVTSVVMVRDLGSQRQPAVFVTIASAILFAICCTSLHRRDKLVRQARAAAGG
ncbi:MAG TPA: hypothetical protein VNL12_10025 [Iamia sp.]|nr:hypothetical protein [Iamia sp.]